MGTCCQNKKLDNCLEKIFNYILQEKKPDKEDLLRMIRFDLNEFEGCSSSYLNKLETKNTLLAGRVYDIYFSPGDNNISEIEQASGYLSNLFTDENIRNEAVLIFFILSLKLRLQFNFDYFGGFKISHLIGSYQDSYIVNKRKDDCYYFRKKNCK